MPPQTAVTDSVLELDNQFCFALHSTARRVVRAYRSALGELDLTYSQYLVMLVLWQWDNEDFDTPTVTALGERLGLDSGTLTPLLRRLEQKELLARERTSDDARELHVRVSPAGRALKVLARRVPVSMLEQSTIPLPELVQLRDQLKRVRDALP